MHLHSGTGLRSFSQCRQRCCLIWFWNGKQRPKTAGIFPNVTVENYHGLDNLSLSHDNTAVRYEIETTNNFYKWLVGISKYELLKTMASHIWKNKSTTFLKFIVLAWDSSSRQVRARGCLPYFDLTSKIIDFSSDTMDKKEATEYLRYFSKVGCISLGSYEVFMTERERSIPLKGE